MPALAAVPAPSNISVICVIPSPIFCLSSNILLRSSINCRIRGSNFPRIFIKPSNCPPVRGAPGNSPSVIGILLSMSGEYCPNVSTVGKGITSPSVSTVGKGITFPSVSTVGKGTDVR